MKNSFKFTVTLLICCLMHLTGCASAPTTSLPSELTGQTGNYPKSVSILAPDFFKPTGAANTEEAKQEWLDEMSQRYGVKFNIARDFYIYTNTAFSASDSETDSKSTDPSISSRETVEQIDKTKFIGLTSIDSFNDLKSKINGSAIYDSLIPLEDYLADNPVWNSLPDDFKSLFEINDHIYAIPTSVSRVQNARITHNEALQETDITVTDLDSFRDFAMDYTKKTKNVVINKIDPIMITDILNAFGLYPGNDSYCPFGYDPTEDCYVDWLTKGAAVDALEYLRELYKAGTLYWGSDLMHLQAKFDSGLYASTYQQYFDYDNCTEVLTLNPKYPQIISTKISGFAMTQDTPQPKETINLLIDMLFSSEKNYLECWLGSSDNYTLNSDGTITVEMVQDSDGNYEFPGMPNLAGELPNIFHYLNTDILYSKNGVVTAESTDTENYKARLKLLNDSLKNGTVIEIPPEYQIIKSATYDANSTDTGGWIGFQYIGCFTNAIISPNKTVQQIIDEYKEKMLNLGGNFMLDEMNHAIGKKTAYYYG